MLDFPIFPDVTDVIYNEASDTVVMPLDLWVRITEYAIDVDAVERTLDGWREVDN